MHVQSLKEMFENGFSRWSEKPAITFYRQGTRESTLTYGQLDRDANQLAHLFKKKVSPKARGLFFYWKRAWSPWWPTLRYKSWGLLPCR